MSGTFSKSNRPRRPGTYVDFIGIAPATVAPAIGSIVAVLFTHDWGPFKTPTLVSSYGEFQGIFGTDDSQGQRAVKMAFQGEGLEGRGGAGAVLCYRIGGSAAAKAAVTLMNTAGTPAAALTLTALYEGALGNTLTATVMANAADPSGHRDLVVYQSGVEVERYTYVLGDINGVAAQVASKSDWITATVVTAASPLALVSNSAFTAGADGATLLAADYTAAMTKLQNERFGVLAPADLTDGSILTSLLTWAQGMNSTGHRFFTVVGGVLNEDIVAANTRSTSLNDPNFLNVGVGSVRDNQMLDVNGNPYVFSTAQLAPRLAGIMAAFGESRSLTGARVAGVELLNGASVSDILKGYDAGTMVLSRDSNVDSPVKIERGLTTYATSTSSQMPVAIFSKPKYMATMHGVEADFDQWFTDNIVGILPVNSTTREAAITHVARGLEIREALFSVQPGWTVEVDPTPAPSDDDEFVALLVGIKFGRSAEQVFLTVRAG